MNSLDKSTISQIEQYVNEHFEKSVIPGLSEYIAIPNTSRLYDKEWETNGLLLQAANHLVQWTKNQDLKNCKVELLNEPTRTPMILIEVDGTHANAETFLFYGHLDKQPHMVGWREGLGAAKPVIENDKLYGRGSSDDGYSIFAAVATIKACQALGLPHPRCVITIEADEESESKDLPYYYDLLADRIGTPNTMICLDSGAGNWDQLWITSTLRGIVECNLSIRISTEGVHSGDASGVVPDTFRILRMLLDRLEDPLTGEMHKDLQVEIPTERYNQAVDVANLLKEKMQQCFPFIPSGKPVDPDHVKIYINRIWKSTLTVTGIDYIPAVANAGNVLRPETRVKLSIRLPPTLKGDKAVKSIQEILTTNPPYGAEVVLDDICIGNGWNAPFISKSLDESINQASLNIFGKEAVYMGEGGSIPFMDILAEKFPKCQFIVTGILGPNTNAHGPNEFLHIPYTKKFIACLVQIVSQAAAATAQNN